MRKLIAIAAAFGFLSATSLTPVLAQDKPAAEKSDAMKPAKKSSKKAKSKKPMKKPAAAPKSGSLAPTDVSAQDKAKPTKAGAR